MNQKMLEEKLSQLKNIISKYESVLVAFSGGCDSSLLLKISKEVLGEKVLAVTAKSPLFPTSELRNSKKVAKYIGAKQLIIESNELDLPQFADNPKNRCYICKKGLFAKLTEIAKREGLNCIVDGTNLSDEDDFRPGMMAAKEFGIRSPLKEASLTKEDVRKISKLLDLPTYNKPQGACLASRFPYGLKITKDALKLVEKSEEFLRKLGLKQVRVRHYQNLCRIEVLKKEMEKCLAKKEQITKQLKSFGYTYITLDLEGYRSGSMNEV
jgi:uncharacterized protein